MKILFDTNVILDVLLQREPWRAEADVLWKANDAGKLTGFVTATTITDVFYIARKLPPGAERAFQAVRTCLAAFQICAVERQTLEQALALPGTDFEDNVQIVCVQLSSLDGVVTRDIDGFTGAPCPVYSPADLLARLP